MTEERGELDVIVVEALPARAQQISASLAASSCIVHILEPGGPLLTRAGWAGPDAVLIGLDGEQGRSLAYAKWAHDTFRRAAVLAYAENYSAETLTAAMSAGVRRVLQFPFDMPALYKAIESVQAEVRDATGADSIRAKLGSIRAAPLLAQSAAPTGVGEKKPPLVVAVCSPKGGVGTTTLAVNLALAILRAGRDTVLVDANLSFGSHDVFLKIPPLRSITQVIDENDQVEPQQVFAALMRHQSGLHVLLAPLRPEEGERLHPEHLERVLWALRDRFDVVVVDAAPPTDPRVLTVLQIANTILVPAGPDLPDMKNLASFLRVLSLMNNGEQRVVPVLMRADGAPAERVKALEAVIRRDLQWRIVGDEARVTEAANTGTPFILSAAQSEIGRNVCDLAQYCIAGDGAADVQPRAKQRRGIGGLFRH